MSVEVMSMVFKRYPVGGGEMMLALALADHAHDDGSRVYPSIKQLAKKTRQSERTVQYQLRKMEDAGWLILVSNGGQGAKDTREWCISTEWLSGENISGFDDRKPVSVKNKGAKIAPLNSEPAEQIRVQSEAIRVQSEANKGAIAVAPESSRIIIQPSEASQPSARGKREQAISWDAQDKMFKGVSEERMQAWEAAFPKFDVEGELTRIDLWYDRRTRESPKFRWRNAERGIHNWLARAFNDARKPKVFAAQQRGVVR